MMAQHLDIKLFNDILKEIKDVSFYMQRSVSTTIDMLVNASDTERDEDFFGVEDKDELKPPPITPINRR